jgi:parallel beta-helix repeat protein
MRKLITFILMALFIHSGAMRAQSSILRGVYLFGRDSVNTIQMRDSLHLNAFQTGTGDSPTVRNDSALKNPAGLKVLNQRGILVDNSSAQRMEYDAWRTDQSGLYNYFSSFHPAIHKTSNEVYLDSSEADSGYMVQSCSPNWAYYYGNIRSGYYATFRLKISGSYGGNPQVVRCSVYSIDSSITLKDTILYANDLLPENSYKDIKLYFNLSPALTNPPGRYTKKYLTGGVNQVTQGNTYHYIDLRVYWFGNVTTYLDNVIVDDTRGDSLFAGLMDDTIKQDAGQFTPAAYPLHDKFYLLDEPPMSTYLAFDYVGKRIRDTLGNIPQAGTVSACWFEIERFLAYGKPAQLINDAYFIYSDTPHPSITDHATAAAAGIPDWDYASYTALFQYHVNIALADQFRKASQAAKQYSMPYIFTPQLHGVAYYQSDGFPKYKVPPNNDSTLRPPAPSEIRLSYNLGIAYGAKGFLPYPFGTDYVQDVDPPVCYPGLVSGRLKSWHSRNYYMDHWKNIDTIYGHDIWTGYKEKWNEVASLNNRLAQIGDTLLALSWVGANSWSNSSGHTDDWSGIVSGITTKDTTSNPPNEQPYVEAGHLKRDATDYIVVVNRRCASNTINNDRRDITVTLGSLSFANVLVTNIETNTAFVVPNAGAFTDRFNPGEGKIYRLENASIANARTFSNLTVGSGATLTIASGGSVQLTSGAGITNNGSLTVSGTLQVNYNLTVSGSGTVTIATGGKVQTSASAILTTASGTSLIAQAGSTFKFGSGSYLVAYGSVNASGSSGQNVLFTSTSASPGLGLWDRISLYGGPNVLQYCTVKYSNFGIYVYGSTYNLIQHCTVDSSLNFGVFAYSNGSSSNACLISSTTITHCYNGIYLSSARSDIRYSTIQNNRANGIVIGGGSTAYIDHSTIQNNTSMGLNISGLYAYGQLGDQLDGRGCNNVFNNFREIYVINSGYAFLGYYQYNPVHPILECGFNDVEDSHTFAGHLIDNLTTNLVSAETCYYGNNPASSRFYGNVDTIHMQMANLCDPQMAGHMRLPELGDGVDGGTSKKGNNFAIEGIPAVQGDPKLERIYTLK